MATPSITRSTRYTSAGVTKVYYLPTVAATNLTPTRPEMNAGTDLSLEVADWAGWTVTSNKIETPDLGSLFTGQIPGKTTAADSSITFYASKDGNDVRGLLPRNTSGYVMFCDGGDIAANKAAVYPVTVMSNAFERAVKGTEADKIMVQFSITHQPSEGVTVPA